MESKPNFFIDLYFLIKKEGFKKVLPFIIVFYLPLVIVQLYNINQFKSLKQTTVVKNSNNVTIQEGNNTPHPNNNLNKNQDISLSSNVFNPDEWIIDDRFKLDEENFYCANFGGFEYWSIWSKKLFSPEFSMKIRLMVKTKNESKLPPTIHISYGDYIKDYSPITFYSLNIFDSDLRSIRLYDEENRNKQQTYLPNRPDLEDEMQITLMPKIPDPNKRIINVNFQLMYNPIDSENTFSFNPKETFGILAPSVNINDDTINKQIGIGTRDGVCFKIMSIELK